MIKINPGAALLAATVPLFLSNDDRGYLSTAAITTPLIFAGQAILPGLFQQAKREGTALSRVMATANGMVDFSGIDRTGLGNLLSNPGASQNAIDRAVSAYMMAPKLKHDFFAEQEALNKFFLSRFVVTPDIEAAFQAASGTEQGDALMGQILSIELTQSSKRRLITNALEAAARDAASPAEWADLSRAPAADLMSNQQMLDIFNRNQHKPDFVRGLSSRLRRIENLNDSGISQVRDGVPKPMTGQVALDLAWGDDAITKSFTEQNPELAEQLRKYTKRARLDKLNAFAEMTTSGEVGRILSVDVGTSSGAALRIPIPDRNGMVRMGQQGGYVGVGRKIIGPDGTPYPVDVWLAKQLNENPGISFADLQEDLMQGSYFSAADPTDAWQTSVLAGSEGSGKALFYPEQIRLRSQVGVVTKLPIFGDGRRFNQLDAIEHTNFVKRLVNSGQFAVMTSEAGVYEGRFALRSLSNLHPLGIPNADKQDPFYRSMTKEFRLSGELEGDMLPKFGSTAYEGLDMARANLRVAGVAPQHKALFGDLPSTAEGFRESRGSLIDRFAQHMGREDAVSTVNELEGLYKNGNFMRNLGRLGETEFMVSDEWANRLNVESNSRYQVSELAVNAGQGVDASSVLGYLDREVVTPDYPGQITSVSDAVNDNGLYDVTVRHNNPLHGAKVDVAGVKGQAFVVPSNDVEDTREFMNRFYSRIGSENYIPSDVRAFADLSYFTQKTEVATTNLSLLGDTLSALDAEPSLQNLVGTWRSMLKARGVAGIDYADGRLMVDHLANPQDFGNGAERMVALAEINEQFFQQAGSAIRKAGNLHNEALARFAGTAEGTSFLNWTMQNNFAAPTFAWDHASAYVSRQLTVTHDVESYMALGGHWAALRELNARKIPIGGNQEMALAFGQHLVSGSGPIGNVIPAGKARLFGGSLTSAAARRGSVLDPSIEEYKNNFTLDMGEGGRHRYVPVPGTEAFGSMSPQFGPGEYQTHAWQRQLQDVLTAESVGGRDTAVDSLLNTYKSEIFTGKNSALRPRSFDPKGVAGFLATRSNAQNPFEVGVSGDVIRRMRSKTVRDALTNGGEAYGMLLRQPTSEAMHVKVVHDPNLDGTHWIGADEAMYRLFQGDADKDPVGLMMWDPGSQAAVEAREAITSGMQQRQIEIFQELKGVNEESRKVTAALEEGELLKRTRKVASSSANAAESAVKRMAGATIGSYSNLLTEVVENMVRNPSVMRDPERAARMKYLMFDLIRQAPISARKSHVNFDLETAVTHAGELKRSFSIENAGEASLRFQEALQNLSSKLYESKDNSVRRFLADSTAAEDILAVMAGRTKEASTLAKAYTDRGKGAVKNLSKVLQNPQVLRGPIHGGAAEEVASSLGVINERLAESASNVTSNIEQEVGGFLRNHGKQAALVGGGLALLGLMTSSTPVASFSNRPSGNKVRPEQAIGSTDHIPGEPVAGTMAPTNPPRRMLPARSGVSTGIVAPIHQTVNLESRMRSEDRGSAIERAKLMSRLSSNGDQNVTVNFRGNSRLTSLRTKEKIKELRES